MPKPVEGGGSAKKPESPFAKLSTQAAQNLKKAKEVADKAEVTVEHSRNFAALCAQFAAQQAQKAGEKHKPAKTTPEKPSKAPEKPSKAPKAPKEELPKGFVEVKPLTPERVSAKPPESKGFLKRLFDAIARAFRALVSCFPSFRSPHST